MNQLKFFNNQIQENPNLKKLVRFLISDNASTDNTSKILDNLLSQYGFFEKHTNKENKGLVGNIITLLNLSTTEYVWFVSDDDDLKGGVISEILNIIANNKNPEFIFLNYSLNGKKGFSGDCGFRLDSKIAALEVFREAYGSLVFMTSCVYKRKNLLELSNNYMFNRLSAPLLYSFYSCSKGSIFITNDIWVKFRPNNASYSGLKNNLKLKFEEYISILEFISKYGYSEFEIKKTIRLFFENQSHSHLLYNFINFINSIRLYRYYSFKTLFFFQKNIINYFRR
jgi:glycosyltransferase involved in cell wall biosynthesis